MGKDSKERPLGDRGSTGGAGFAESGARNWLHSAATVLAFLQKERELLQPGNTFQPLVQDGVVANSIMNMSDAPSKRPPAATRRIESPKPAPDLIKTSSPKPAAKDDGSELDR